MTYEPQVNSDVFGMFQSHVEGRVVSWDLLVKDVPKDKHQDLDYIDAGLERERQPQLRPRHQGIRASGMSVHGERGQWVPRAVGVVRHCEALGERTHRTAEASHGRWSPTA